VASAVSHARWLASYDRLPGQLGLSPHPFQLSSHDVQLTFEDHRSGNPSNNNDAGENQHHAWAEKFVVEFADFQMAKLPWLKKPGSMVP
jgi:hypothetical protein